MILPEGNIRKFVKMVIGLIIILVIINPFIKLVQGDIDIEKEVLKNIKKQYNYDSSDYSEFESHQEQQIKEVYSSQIQNEIDSNILSKTKYQLERFLLEIDENKDLQSYGSIKVIDLTLSEKNYKKNMNTKKVNNIKDIKIDINIKNAINDNQDIKSKESYSKNPKDLENIRREISKRFEIPNEKVSLKLQTNE